MTIPAFNNMDGSGIINIDNGNVSIGFGCLKTFVSSYIVGSFPGVKKYVLCIDSYLVDITWRELGSNGPLLTKLMEFFQEYTMNQGKMVMYHVLPQGQKTRKVKEELEDFMLRTFCHRDTLMVAIGGGCVSDLVGFTAATYCRGIPWVAIPTTLLSMVDASIGGKTGLDIAPFGKNLIGSFWNPSKILIDLSFLNLQSEDHWRQGWAEMVKLAIVFDNERFNKLENIFGDSFYPKDRFWSGMWKDEINIRPKTAGFITDWIIWSINTKLSVTEQDWRDTSGTRSLLNFGHTIGHALENVSMMALASNCETISASRCRAHGDSVGYGMVFETELCCYTDGCDGKLSEGDCYRITYLLENEFGWKKPNIKVFLKEMMNQILEATARDKKSSDNKTKFVKLEYIGHAKELCFYNTTDVKQILSDSVNISANPSNCLQTRTITVPGSKSITNRALLLSCVLSFCQNSVKLSNVLHSRDTYLMINALRTIGGFKFMWGNASRDLIVSNSRRKYSSNRYDVEVGNAGTVVRFMIPFCLLIMPLIDERVGPDIEIVFRGDRRMKERPFGQILNCINEDCLKLCREADEGYDDSVPIISAFPCRLDPTFLDNEYISIKPKGSSQFISGLLMAIAGRCFILCSKTSAENRQNIIYKLLVENVQNVGEIDSGSYISMTIKMIHDFFGSTIELTSSSENGWMIVISGKCSSKALKPLDNYTIEADLTSASYPCTAAALSGSSLLIPNIFSDFRSKLQGDIHYLGILSHFGCKIKDTKNNDVDDERSLLLEGQSLNGIFIDRECSGYCGHLCVVDYRDFDTRKIIAVNFSGFSDTFMTFSMFIACIVLANRKSGTGISFNRVILSGISSQEDKECKRITTIHDILSTQLGICSHIENNGDSLVIDSKWCDKPIEKVVIAPQQDHRIAMACSLLCFALDSADQNLVILEKDCTSKTWPTYWKQMKSTFNWTIDVSPADQ